MANWINPAFNTMIIAQRLVRFESAEDRETWQEVIDLWQQADDSRNQPRELLRLFGEGLARFLDLPDNLKSYAGMYVRNALTEASHIATVNKIRVTFGSEGAVFS